MKKDSTTPHASFLSLGFLKYSNIWLSRLMEPPHTGDSDDACLLVLCLFRSNIHFAQLAMSRLINRTSDMIMIYFFLTKINTNPYLFHVCRSGTHSQICRGRICRSAGKFWMRTPIEENQYFSSPYF